MNKLNPINLTQILEEDVCPNIKVYGDRNDFNDSNCSTGRAICIACKYEYSGKLNCEYSKDRGEHCFHPKLEKYFLVVLPVLGIHSEP